VFLDFTDGLSAGGYFLLRRGINAGERQSLYQFKREERLKKRDEIGKVFKEGKVVSCSGAKLFVVRNGLDYNRIAFAFSRKFGNAVQRNRARRLGREAYRLKRNRLKTGFDLVLLVYPGKDALSARMEQAAILFSRADLYIEVV
jgi:ribonuclease P protein component